MTSAFIPEHEVYELLSAVGISTPRHCFIEDVQQLANAPFEAGEPVVVKGVARDLWHKSDSGALAFCDFDSDAIAAMHGRMQATVGERFDWLGTLVAKRVEFQRERNAPSEIFVSLHQTT